MKVGNSLLSVWLIVVSIGPARASPPFSYDDAHPLARLRFKSVDKGLPGNIDESELISQIDPRHDGVWAFGWFIYGERNTRSVTVGWRDGTQLFVDLDRNQRFSRDERIKPSDKPHLFRTAIGAEFFTNDNQYHSVERSIVLQIVSSGEFQIATAGVLAGTVHVAGQPVQVVRMDRDANGRWFDADDRLLLDKNRDGNLHRIGERVACNAICRIDGRRFVLQSDQLGDYLALSELEGTGELLPKIKLRSARSTVESLSGTIASRSGVRVAIRSLGQDTECPVGEYRIEELTLKVRGRDKSYLYRFAGLGRKKFPIRVKADQVTEFDLLGDVTLSTGHSKIHDEDGTDLTFTPMLKSSTGIFLMGCLSGRTVPTLENRLLAEARIDGRVVDTNSTGFS